LERIAYALGSVRSPSEMRACVLERGGDAVGATHGAIWEIDDDHGLQRVHSTSGDDRASLDAAPVADTLHSLEPLWIEGLDHYRLLYPTRALAHSSDVSIACLPLVVEGRRLGALSFFFAAGHTFDPIERSFLSILAQHVAQSLERARLFQRTKASEEAQRFLAEVGAALAESLDTAMTMNVAAKLAVPVLGDGCLIFVAHPSGRMVNAAISHRDPQKLALLQALRSKSSPDQDKEHFVHAVLQAPTPLAINDLQPAEVAASAKEAEHAAMLLELDLCAAIVVPLVARGQTLGAICLGRHDRARPFSTQELALAEEYARRLAMHLDNARLYRQAELAVQRRSDFLSMASHELRTPLTTLQLQVDGLIRAARQGGAHTSPELLDRLSRIGRQGRRLNTLVSDLLDISRLGDERLQLERSCFDLAELCREIVERLEESARQRITLYAEGAAKGVWDRMRIDQVITNLIANAIKYGRDNMVEVTLRSVVRGVELSVRDWGIGISPEDQRRIFQKFERTTGAKRFAGFGLGLWIVEQIVDAHGGRVSVSSVLGEGSTFVVWLPLGDDSAERQALTLVPARST
jgi:signal transduction histidine kinase